MLAAVLSALFPSDGNWIWRRRTAVSSAAVFLTGVLHSIFVDYDPVHSKMVMDACTEGLALVMTIYVGGAVYDAHSKRKIEALATPPAGSAS